MTEGFSVYLEEGEEGSQEGRFLTDEEIKQSHLYMACDGQLVRVEVYIDKDRQPVRYARCPRDLAIMPRKKESSGGMTNGE